MKLLLQIFIWFSLVSQSTGQNIRFQPKQWGLALDAGFGRISEAFSWKPTFGISGSFQYNPTQWLGLRNSLRYRNMLPSNGYLFEGEASNTIATSDQSSHTLGFEFSPIVVSRFKHFNMLLGLKTGVNHFWIVQKINLIPGIMEYPSGFMAKNIYTHTAFGFSPLFGFSINKIKKGIPVYEFELLFFYDIFNKSKFVGYWAYSILEYRVFGIQLSINHTFK